MQRAEKAARPTGGTSQRQPAAARMAAPEAPSPVSDQRPDTIAQPELLQLAAPSPRVAAPRTLIDGIHGSSRMVAQRQQLRGIFGGAVQLQGGLEDEEPVQGRFEAAQRQGADDEALQMKAAPAAPARLEAEFPAPPNRSGLPDGLKAGIESLSGIAMDPVRVHYNSAQPAQLNALAYAQGSDIHIAPGQERHLPHEAWHVVQQAQGRVRPTMQMKDGVAVNDDQGLEHEADVMGAEADAVHQLAAGLSPLQGPAQRAENDPRSRRDRGQGRKETLNSPSSSSVKMDLAPGVESLAAKALQMESAVTQLQPKPVVANRKLANYVNALFKEAPVGGAQIGDGSAMAACAHEVNGGARVGGRDHIQKCREMLNGIRNLLDKDENPRSPFQLSDADYEVAANLEEDLEDALDGTYAGGGGR